MKLWDTATSHSSLLTIFIDSCAKRIPQLLTSNSYLLTRNTAGAANHTIDGMYGLAKVLVGTWIQPCTGDGVHADGTELQACTWNFDNWIAAPVAGQSEGCCKFICVYILVRFRLIFFIHSSNRFFHWARGASARGRTIERGKSSLVLGSPLSLRFSPSRSLFPHPLLSGGVSHMFDVSHLFERKTITKKCCSMIQPIPNERLTPQGGQGMRKRVREGKT